MTKKKTNKMIQANELRIGSYLFKHGEVVKIVEIGIKHKGDTNYYLRSENDNCGYWIDQFKPIPLTEEILLKCGFKSDGLLYEFRTSKYVLKSDFEYVWIYDVELKSCICVKCKHLHQLQNFYWCLCEKELEINL